MPLRDEHFPADAWIRTCQECAHVQQTTPPPSEKIDRWLEKKCQLCKSIALDYGMRNEYFLDEGEIND